MRLPIQIQCIVFRKKGNKTEFLLLKRIPEKGGFWQPVCGGFEDTDRGKLACAYRELKEEAFVQKKNIIRVIENVHYFVMEGHYITKEPIKKVEEFVYAFEVKPDTKIDISKNIYPEHSEFKWVSFDKAVKMLKWKNNEDGFRKLIKLI